jgi:hypothetical protein
MNGCLVLCAEIEDEWFRQAAEAGQAPAMHDAGLQGDGYGQEYWLPAMCEVGLLSSNLDEKRRWLEEAARNGWQAAMLALADWD